MKRECDIYFFPSINHEIHLQQVLKTAPSAFDAKRCYISKTGSTYRNKNFTESHPANFLIYFF